MCYVLRKQSFEYDFATLNLKNDSIYTIISIKIKGIIVAILIGHKFHHIVGVLDWHFLKILDMYQRIG